MAELKVKYIPIGDVKPYGKNPRKNAGAVKYVANSLREFGWRQPIVIDSGGVIVAGHTRLLAAQQLGMKTVPVVVADDLTPEQIKAYRLADNKTAEFAEWDADLLDMELDDLDDIDMSLFGFELDEGETSGEIIEDEAPEEAEARCKPGDIWQLGNHRLICGDSTDPKTVDALMNGELADMVFTDPPYGVSYTDKNEFLNSIDKPICVVNAIQNDSKTPEEMYEFWVKAFKNLVDYTSDKMSYYITAPQGGDLLLLLTAVRDSGFSLRHVLVWNKNNHVLGRCDYNYKHEPIVYGWKQKGTHTFYGNGEMKTSVWDIPRPQRSDLHPTMKPIELIANALMNSTIEGDIVLDLFGGSGSTLIACEQLKRKCFMAELDPHYCDVIIERWENLTGEKATLLSQE